MPCLCAKLPDVFYLDEGPRGFGKKLSREETGNWIWLGSCPECGTLWAVDEWDKYQPQVVMRVEDRANWEGTGAAGKRKRLLLTSRGGLTDKECIRAGCHQKAVKGVVYCLDHLWETGARR
jgi:hypothetical protein